MNPTTASTALDTLVDQMTSQIATVTRSLASWMQESPRSLGDAEQTVLTQIRAVAATLLTGLVALVTSTQVPEPTIPCRCGQHARYQRQRLAQVTTLVGAIPIPRAYYHCPACHQGHCPADVQLQILAGSRSAGLDELLALLGATQDSFSAAACVLERLSLVHVCANTVRSATEGLGAVLVARQAATAERHQTMDDLPAPTSPPVARIPRLYISMDGIQTHLRETGWSEMKVGCVYQTRTRPDRQRPEQLTIRLDQPSYCAALVDATTFGSQIWSEAVRRGVLHADEIIVVGDGSHWIWNIADTQFAGATQILDWYHASSYVWDAAHAIWPTVPSARTAWAKTQLDRLWAGQVDAVITELDAQQGHGAAVTTARTYYTNQRCRMDYPTYRARGLQIGSGSIESACKQVITTRLKLAGMIWDASGAEEVATVRAWLKSGRWAEAMALRPRRQRTYARTNARAAAIDAVTHVPAQLAPAHEPVAPPRRSTLPPELRERIQRELAEERKPENHPWRQPVSKRQQRAHAETRMASQTPSIAV